MINFETFCKIKQLRDRDGLNRSQIAEELGLDLRTVSKWFDEKQFKPRKKTNRPSKLDPFKPLIIKLIETHPYSAKQIFQRIQEEGFSGGYTIVRDYVHKVRPQRSTAYLKLAFAPGECAQVDWGSFGSIATGETNRRLSFFVMVMCYSRKMYLEFTVSQTMEHWLSCHQNALRFFGGVPKKIMIDNLKSAVIKRAIGQAPVFNQKYLDFANHHGFTIVPCGVAKGNEKGRVESGVGYIKKNFLNGLTMPSLEALQRASSDWLENTANQRIHGETRKRPVDLFAEERLNLLPVQGYDCAAIKQMRASSQFRISLDSNRYSVPAEYANCKLTGKIYPDRICIYDQDKLIARHHRSYDRHQDFENPDHPKALLAQHRKAHNQQILRRFLTISPKAQSYYQKLEERRMNPMTHIRKIVALSEIHGSEAVSRAINDAFIFAAFSSEYIANLLEQRSRNKTEPAALHLSRKEDLLEIDVDEPNFEIYTI